MNTPWKLVLVLVGIFVAGGVTGSFLTLRFGREWVVKRPGPDQWAPNHTKRLAERLSLEPEQTEQVRPIVRRYMEELSRVRNESMTTTRSVFERMEREISEKLTPEQRVKYDELNKEMRERAKKVMPEKPKPPAPESSTPTGAGKSTGVPAPAAVKPASER